MQHHGPVGLGLLFEEFAGCSLFNDFAQPQKMIDAPIWFHVTATFRSNSSVTVIDAVPRCCVVAALMRRQRQYVIKHRQ